jgi:predicted transcriptional regulator of viral defense system
MRALEFLNQLNDLKIPLVQTREIASVLNISVSSAGKYLENLREQNFVEKITHGKWALKNGNFDPLQAAEFITAPKESYISLHTALFYHGMIEQIPGQIYAVTVDRSRTVHTPVGVFSFHHCNPDFFTGYAYIKPFLKVATPEKALVDYFYFAPTKSRQFTRLPELEIPKRFSWKKAFSFCEKIPSPRTRSLVSTRIKQLKESNVS